MRKYVWFTGSDNPVSATNKTDRHDITQILLTVALNTENLKFQVSTLTSVWTNLCYLYQNT